MDRQLCELQAQVTAQESAKVKGSDDASATTKPAAPPVSLPPKGFATGRLRRKRMKLSAAASDNFSLASKTQSTGPVSYSDVNEMPNCSQQNEKTHATLPARLEGGGAPLKSTGATSNLEKGESMTTGKLSFTVKARSFRGKRRTVSVSSWGSAMVNGPRTIVDDKMAIADEPEPLALGRSRRLRKENTRYANDFFQSTFTDEFDWLIYYPDMPYAPDAPVPLGPHGYVDEPGSVSKLRGKEQCLQQGSSAVSPGSSSYIQGLPDRDISWNFPRNIARTRKARRRSFNTLPALPAGFSAMENDPAAGRVKSSCGRNWQCGLSTEGTPLKQPAPVLCAVAQPESPSVRGAKDAAPMPNDSVVGPQTPEKLQKRKRVPTRDRPLTATELESTPEKDVSSSSGNATPPEEIVRAARLLPIPVDATVTHPMSGPASRQKKTEQPSEVFKVRDLPQKMYELQYPSGNLVPRSRSLFCGSLSQEPPITTEATPFCIDLSITVLQCRPTEVATLDPLQGAVTVPSAGAPGLLAPGVPPSESHPLEAGALLRNTETCSPDGQCALRDVDMSCTPEDVLSVELAPDVQALPAHERQISALNILHFQQQLQEQNLPQQVQESVILKVRKKKFTPKVKVEKKLKKVPKASRGMKVPKSKAKNIPGYNGIQDGLRGEQPPGACEVAARGSGNLDALYPLRKKARTQRLGRQEQEEDLDAAATPPAAASLLDRPMRACRWPATPWVHTFLRKPRSDKGQKRGKRHVTKKLVQLADIPSCVDPTGGEVCGEFTLQLPLMGMKDREVAQALPSHISHNEERRATVQLSGYSTSLQGGLSGFPPSTPDGTGDECVHKQIGPRTGRAEKLCESVSLAQLALDYGENLNDGPSAAPCSLGRPAMHMEPYGNQGVQPCVLEGPQGTPEDPTAKDIDGLCVLLSFDPTEEPPSTPRGNVSVVPTSGDSQFSPSPPSPPSPQGYGLAETASAVSGSRGNTKRSSMNQTLPACTAKPVRRSLLPKFNSVEDLAPTAAPIAALNYARKNRILEQPIPFSRMSDSQQEQFIWALSKDATYMRRPTDLIKAMTRGLPEDDLPRMAAYITRLVFKVTEEDYSPADSRDAPMGVEKALDIIEKSPAQDMQIVPYGDGLKKMVLYRERPLLWRRRDKYKPKVVLDSDTVKMFKRLMLKGGGGAAEDDDQDDEAKWEQARQEWKIRAHHFNAVMRQIQGDRAFSKWGGSVVDSVGGAFLTQNVSDFLSSTAFMALRARFPAQGRATKGAGTQAEEEEQPPPNAEPARDASNKAQMEEDHSHKESFRKVGSSQSVESSVDRGNVCVDEALAEALAELPTKMEGMCLVGEDDTALEVVLCLATNSHDETPLATPVAETHDRVELCPVSDIQEETAVNAESRYENAELCLVADSQHEETAVASPVAETQNDAMTEEEVQTIPCPHQASGNVPEEAVDVHRVSVCRRRRSWNTSDQPTSVSQSEHVDAETRITSLLLSFEPEVTEKPVETPDMRLAPDAQTDNSFVRRPVTPAQMVDEQETRDFPADASPVAESNADAVVGTHTNPAIANWECDTGARVERTASITDVTSMEGVVSEESDVGAEPNEATKGSKGAVVEMANTVAVTQALVEGPDVPVCTSDDHPQESYTQERIPGNPLNNVRTEKSLKEILCCCNIAENLVQVEECMEGANLFVKEGGLAANEEDSATLVSCWEGHFTAIQKKFEYIVEENLSSLTVVGREKVLAASLRVILGKKMTSRELAKDLAMPLEIAKLRPGRRKLRSKTNNFRYTNRVEFRLLSGLERARWEEGYVMKSQKEKWEPLRAEILADEDYVRDPFTTDCVDWEAVRRADVDKVANVIKDRGMNNILAGRIKAFLERIYREQNGSLDLEWIRKLPPDDAKEFLLSVRGLGLKSVECIRLLTLHHPSFPVDTNVGRIVVRLGWVPLEPLPEETQLHLLELYPVQAHIQQYLWPRLCTLDQQTLYELHYQMITFGKVFCTKSKPNCNACPMRSECKHFASAYSSAKLLLKGPEKHAERPPMLALPATEREETQALSSTAAIARASRGPCIPIIEVPSSPESVPDIEDIPFHIELNITSSVEVEMESLALTDLIIDLGSPSPVRISAPPRPDQDLFDQAANLEEAMKVDMEVETAVESTEARAEVTIEDVLEEDPLPQGLVGGGSHLPSQELILLPPQAAYQPVPQLKNVQRLRTVHYVYELPDNHPLLAEMDKREADDPCFYLLAIWSPDEVPASMPNINDDDASNPFASCHDGEHEESIRGTLLVPCRTAMKGCFPLNGTYFQVNEVFADHASSVHPIEVPRTLLWSLRRRFVYFGTSVTSLFRDMSQEEIQCCFKKGYVCVRAFDQTTRQPKLLAARLHQSGAKIVTAAVAARKGRRRAYTTRSDRTRMITETQPLS